MAGIVTPSQPHVVMGFKLKKCPHSPEVNSINSFPGHWTVEDLYGDIHNIASKGSTFEACGFKDIMSGGITFNIGFGGTLTLSSGVSLEVAISDSLAMVYLLDFLFSLHF
jgi:hypothetical protein